MASELVSRAGEWRERDEEKKENERKLMNEAREVMTTTQSGAVYCVYRRSEHSRVLLFRYEKKETETKEYSQQEKKNWSKPVPVS